MSFGVGDLSAWVLSCLWDSLDTVGLGVAAICVAVGLFVFVLRSQNKELPLHPQPPPERRDDMAAVGGDHNGLTAEEEEEFQKALKESRETYEREKKVREKGRRGSAADNTHAAAAGSDFAIPTRDEWSQMPLDDRARIAMNLAATPEDDDGDDIQAILSRLPPEERPNLLGERGKRKIVAAERRINDDGEGAFLPPPPRAVAEGASSLPRRDDEDEELELAKALSLSEAQARAATPASRPSPATTPQEQQQQPQFSEQDDDQDLRRAVQLSLLEPGSGLTRAQREEQEYKEAIEKSARESLEADMAARAVSQKARRAPGSRRPIVLDGMNVGHEHGNHDKFSAMGLQIAWEHFRNNGWEDENIKIFVKRNRRFHTASQADKDLCDRLNKAAIVVYPHGNYDDM